MKTDSVTEELHSSLDDNMDTENLNKLKKSRATYAGWVTRTLNYVDQVISSPHVSVIIPTRDRLTGQLKKLQSAHDVYITALTEDEDIDGAEQWMDEYMRKATAKLGQLEDQISALTVLNKSKSIVHSHVNANEVEEPLPGTSKQSVSVTPLPEVTTTATNATSTPSVVDQPSSSTPSSTSQVSFSATSLSSTPAATSVSPSSPFVSQSLNPAASEFVSRRPSDSASSAASFVEASRPVDAWIDDLVPGMETAVLSPSVTSNDLALTVARLELDRDLPKVELPSFDGTPIMWPRFVEQFYIHVHSRGGLSDARRIEILQSHVTGDAKKLIHGLGYSSHNYAQCLQELKFAFGHRVAVARAYINSVVSGGILQSGDASALRAFYVAVRDCITTLQRMQYTGELNSSDVLQRASKRIPNDKRNKWNDFIRNVCRSREPTLTDLLKWLKDNVESEFCPYALPARVQKTYDQSQQRTFRTTPVHHSTVNSTSVAEKDNTKERTMMCSLCPESHHTSRCKEYLSKSPEERYAVVMASQLCLNCLYPRHRVADCTSKNVCKSCGKRHHSTLHRNNPSKVDAHVNSQVGQSVHVVNQISSVPLPNSTVYFQVLPVTIQGQNGRCMKTFALLDSGSDISLINTELAKDLGLKGQEQNLVVDTMGPTFNFRSTCVSFSVKAGEELGAESLCIAKAWTRPGVFNCPSFNMSELNHMTHLRGLNLADVKSHDVKLLIGANVPRAHLQLETRQGSLNDPIAIHTPLGWCVMGGRDSVTNNVVHVNFLSNAHDDLNSRVEQFWQTESFGVKNEVSRSLSVQDQRAMQVLEQNTKFVKGHYEVPMLWKDPDVKMPYNRFMAEKRFETLTKRFTKDPVFQSRYSDVMNSYIDKGFARKLNADEMKVVNDKTWYLPHHSVLNPKKPNKVRVVFDAAASLKGVSLNSQLVTGPDLLNSLFGVLVRFRLKPVALVADIADMFYQVLVPDHDSDSLRFLWKTDFTSSDPPDEYKMNVHIFGAADSPCCCNYALRRAALDQGDSNDLAVHTVLRNFYVDDMLTAVSDVQTAISLASRISDILQSKGFQLTKWISSSKEVLHSIPPEHRANPDLQVEFSDLPTERVLGIGWDVEKDAFVFRPVIKSVPMTKRGIIAAVSSVFDPLGFLATFIFPAKCLIQELWRLKLDWDDAIPKDLQAVWEKWFCQLKFLADLNIPRQFQYSGSDQTYELHLFSDASELGFASVAYLRIQLSSSQFVCHFLAAKSHLAPVKKVLTIPKLELQGAVMSVRLSQTLQSELDVKLSRVVYWTDALTVLRYIQNDEKRWKIFVANRIAEIRENTEPKQWKFVPGPQNPADAATRGLQAQDITVGSVWFQGPEFLKYDENNWPEFPKVGPPAEDDENLRRPAVVNVMQSTQPGDLAKLKWENLIQPERYSSWQKLKRHAAWVIRAVKNFLSHTSRFKVSSVRNHSLLFSEIEFAETCLLRKAQVDGFSRDYANLSSGLVVSPESPVKSLDPFYDVDLQLIRVGGRLKNVPKGIESQQQILLPYDHHIAKLILLAEHRNSAHSGPEHLVSMVRQRFWPVKCRLMAKKIIHDCFDCRRRTSLPAVPFMSDLPFERVAGFTKPFQFTGVDYFGPMLVKRARSRIKRWGCLFSCLVTRAVHLELADSLETDDFILVLRCFISRRGKPQQMFSDNGTNFIGADRELLECLENLKQDKIHDYLIQSRITWNFIPPNAPHFGGVWEIMVKAVKRALKAVLKETCVTESVLRTTLTEVENVINSRPLTQNSQDPNDLSAITPNHFLHGVYSAVVPPDQCNTSEIDSRKRWRQSQVLSDHIWHRWLREYLPSLNVRHKWTKEQRAHAVGDLVLVIDNNRPRGQWSLGRIQEIIPSKDGKIRTVKVKTGHGVYVRPVAKICLLEESNV